MKASVIIGFLYAGLASASACRPSKVSTSSVSPSSSSTAPSATPDPNIAAADSNIAANPNNRWEYGGNDGSMVATTCVTGDPIDSCLVYTLDYSFAEDYLMYITYYAPTLVEGNTYTWSFDMMHDASESGNIQFQVLDSYYSVILNTNIDISSISSTDWTPLSYTFTATAADNIAMSYYMDDAPTTEHLQFRNFQLVAA
ncbi:hypothetical protein SEUCBS139899_009705 [Sporothrix eucalyptigena]|uniref:CBM-cenC domain-containing protein n=1 Tax=Sporothrix eucalyptigena TaxID=1812306 RepID=A0ABP0CE89_9PEZI